MPTEPSSIRIAAFSDYCFNRRMNASMDELDDVYSEFQENTNMSASQLEDWADHPCASEASVDHNAVIKRNLRLLNKKKSDWETKDIKDAKRTINFNQRMQGSMGDNPSDGKTVEGDDGREVQCPSKAVISLRNWALDPLSRYNSQTERLNAEQKFKVGDVVTTENNGDGGVAEVMTENFTVPVGDEDDEDEEASGDSPSYLVLLVNGGFGVFKGSELSAGPDSLTDEDEPDDPAELAEEVRQNANIIGADDPEVGFAPGKPEGWTRKSYIQAYISLGGSWTSCVNEMTGEIRSPKRWCSALKSEVYGTERWRGRF